MPKVVEVIIGGQTMKVSEEVAAQIAALQAENQKLAQVAAARTRKAGFSIATNAKGAMQIYGAFDSWGRYPITVHPDQWAVIKAHSAEIDAYIADNRADLVKMESIIADWKAKNPQRAKTGAARAAAPVMSIAERARQAAAATMRERDEAEITEELHRQAER